jgi:hypothetical protein
MHTAMAMTMNAASGSPIHHAIHAFHSTFHIVGRPHHRHAYTQHVPRIGTATALVVPTAVA